MPIVITFLQTNETSTGRQTPVKESKNLIEFNSFDNFHVSDKNEISFFVTSFKI